MPLTNFEIIHLSWTGLMTTWVAYLTWARHRDAKRERELTFELELQPYADAPPYFLFRCNLIARNGGLDGLELLAARLKRPCGARFARDGDPRPLEERLSSGDRAVTFPHPIVVEPKASQSILLLAVHRPRSERFDICSLEVTFVRRDQPTKTRRKVVKARPRKPIEKAPLVTGRPKPQWISTNPDWLRRD